MLIDRDGRVRVVDFGLAATAESPEPPDIHDVPLTASARGFEATVRSSPGLSDMSSGSYSSPLRRTGDSMIGTPAYMAPEQHLGAPADARADQFSFCAALYEGLYGVRPVPGNTLAELRHNLMTGALHSPPAGSPVPPWLRRVVLRGLSLDPEQRYSSMAELLTDLGHDPALARRRVLLVVLIALALLAAVALGYAASAWRDDEQARGLAALRDGCAAAGHDLLADAWSAPRRAAAEQALLATDLPYAADTWTRVQTRLDAYASDLQDMSIETCTYAQIRGATAPADDPRTACLRRLAAGLAALTDTLVAADARVVERAVQAAAALPPPARCSDATAEPTPDDPQRATAVQDLRLRLARARARAAAGRYADAAADAAAIATDAATLAAPGVQAEALLSRGLWQEQSGEIQAAEATLGEAYFLAEQAARDDLRVDAAASLAGVVGLRLARLPEGQAWLRQAWSAAARIELARDLRIRLLSTDSGLLRAQKKLPEAGEKLARAVAIAEQLHGSDDPRLAAVIQNLGVNAFDRGDYPGAETLYTRALAIFETALGPHHPDLAPTLNNLGTVHEKLGRFPEAVAAMQRALQIRESSVGPHHPGVAVSLTNLGVLALRRHQPVVAEAHFRRALEIFEAALGEDHPHVASALGGLGRALVAQTRLADARPLHTRARRILETSLGPDNPLVGFALLDLAELELAAEDPTAAVPLATRALELRESEKPEEQAAAQFMLARALHAAHQDPARVATLAASAELTYRDAGPGARPELEEIAAWRAALQK